MNTGYNIPRPPKDIFLHQKEEVVPNLNETPESVLRENPKGFLVKRIEINEATGIFIHYEDCPYPRRGFPFPEAVASINIVKRMIMDTVRLLSSKEIILSWILILVSKRRIERIEAILSLFNRSCFPLIKQYIVKPNLMTPLASELQGIIYGFLAYSGISTPIAKQTAYIFGEIFEYDNAYRFRVQDLFTESSKELLTKNPIKEIRRLLKIYMSREGDRVKLHRIKGKRYVSDKFKEIALLVSIALLIPKLRKAFIKAIANSDFDRLKLDEIDKFWCKNREDYNFQGLTYEERMKDYKTIPSYEFIFQENGSTKP